MRAICLALEEFRFLLKEETVAVMADNTTALAYIRNEGGTHSSTLNSEAQIILSWAERWRVRLVPRFVPGRLNVDADALSRQKKPSSTEWTLHQEEVNRLLKKWPAVFDLFATRHNYRLQNFYSPYIDPMAVNADSLVHPWHNMQAYAFPPFTLIRAVLNKVRKSRNLQLTLIAPDWPAKEWYPDLRSLAVGGPDHLPLRKDLLRQPHFHLYHRDLPGLSLAAWRLSSG